MTSESDEQGEVMEKSLIVFLLTGAAGEEKDGKGRQTLVAFVVLYFFHQIDGSRVSCTMEQLY